jgi:hypothetical protein
MLTTCERFINLVHFQEPELIDLESRFPSMRRGRVVPRSPPPEEDVKGDAFIAKSMKIQVITKKCYQIGDTRGGFVFFDNAGIVLGRNTTKTTYDLKDFDIVGPIHNDFLLERSGVAMNGGHVAMGNAIGLICSELSEYISRQAFSVIILRRDAKLSMIPPSSLLLVSSRTPSNEEADAASDRRELDAAVEPTPFLPCQWALLHKAAQPYW